MAWYKKTITTDNGERVEAQSPLIISASRSTDIPAFYADWFFYRLEKGYSAWTNPFNGVRSYVSYSDTRFIVFWSKNPKPLLKHLDKLAEKNIGCYIQYTLNDYVDEHLEVESAGNLSETDSNPRFDISKIDFDLLRREFARRKEKNLVMKDIQDLLEERIAQMISANPSRINFYDKYQEIINNYNKEQNRASIEKTFEDLMHLTEELSEEEKRYIREGFENDEQLSLYDVLFKDDLSKEDIKKLKNVAKDLLGKIKSMLRTMDHPFDKQETKASIVVSNPPHILYTSL